MDTRCSEVLDLLGPLPNVDPVVAVVVPGHLHTMQAGRPADFSQHLRLDLFCVVRHLRLFHRHSFVLVRGDVLELFHYLLGSVKIAGMLREPYEKSSNVKRRAKLRAIRKSKLPLKGISFSTCRSTITILTASGDVDKGNGLLFFFPASCQNTVSAYRKGSNRWSGTPTVVPLWGGFILPHGRNNSSSTTSLVLHIT